MRNYNSDKLKTIDYETCSTETHTSAAGYNENSHLIQKKLNIEKNSKYEKEHVSNKICSNIIAMLQGVEVLCYYSILFIFKDNYKMDPAYLDIMMTLIKLPWSIKLLWAIISDSFPIFGYRRKYYLFIGSILCVISTLILGLIEHNNIVLTTSLLIMYFFGSAVCNVIGEGQVVESGRKNNITNSAKIVSTFFAFRKFSFAFMSYLSGFLLSVMSKQHIFLIGSILPIIVFISSFFFIENKNYRRMPIDKQLKYVRDIIKIPSIKNSIIFIFLMMSSPSCGNVLFYFMTNKLNFSPELLGKMTMFQSIASLIAILAYIFLFTEVDISKLLFYSTIIVTPFCLLPLIVVNGWNEYLHIPNTAFIVTDTIFVEFIGEFQTIPLLVLCSNIIPDGLECTIYSLLISANNLAGTLSSIISSFITYLLGITATNFDNLSLMIIICAITNLIPIFFLYILPKYTTNENEINERQKRNIYQNDIKNSEENETLKISDTNDNVYDTRNQENINKEISLNNKKNTIC